MPKLLPGDQQEEEGQGGKGVSGRPTPVAPPQAKPGPKFKPGPGPDLDKVAHDMGLGTSAGEAQRAAIERKQPQVHPYQPGNDFVDKAPGIIFQDTTAKINVEDDDPSYLQALNSRAEELDPVFVQKYPGEAAALLTSAVPNVALKSVSEKYNELAGFHEYETEVDGVPSFLTQYYAKAFNAPSPLRRAQALNFLDEVRKQPTGTMFQYLQQHITEFDGLVADHTAGGVTVAVVGGIASAPILALAGAAEGGATVAGAGLDIGLSAAGLEGWGDKIRHGADAVAGAAGAAPEYLGKSVRLGYGTALAAGYTFYTQGHGEYTPKEAFLRYGWNASFGEPEHGMGPAATLFFDTTGLDPQQYEGLSAVVDMTGDVAGGYGIFRGAAEIRGQYRTPASVGGGRLGESWVNTRAGRNLVDVVDRVSVEAAKKGEDGVAYLRNNVSKSMPVALAEELVSLTTKDARARAIANWADNTPDPAFFADTRMALKDVHERLQDARETTPPEPVRLSGPGEVRVGFDEPLGRARYIWTTEEGYRGIVDSGVIEPRVAPLRGGEEPAVWAFDNPTTYTGGETRTVLLRVSEDAPVTWRGAGDELSTLDSIPAEYVDAYTGPQNWQPLRGQGNPVIETELLARKTALEQEILDANTRLANPIWEWPAVSKLKPIIMDAPVSPIQKVLANLYRPLTKTKALDVRSFINDMSPREQVIYNPAILHDNPPGFMEHNFKVLENNWRIMGMKPEIQRLLLDDLVKVKTRHGFKEWVDNAIAAQKEALSKGSKRDLKLVKESEDVLSYSNRTREDAMLTPHTIEGTTSDGVPVRQTKNILEDESGWPMPVLEQDFMSAWNLSPIETVRAASSTLHYADQWLKSKPYMGKVWSTLRVPIDGARFLAFTLPRLVLKPLLFVTSPTKLTAKVQIDQGLRASVMGMNPLKLWGRSDLDFLPDGTPIAPGTRGIAGILPENDINLLGTLKDTGIIEGQVRRVPVSTRHLDPNFHKVEINEVAGGVYDSVMHFRNSELARTVASRGADGTLRFIEQHPESDLAAFVRTDLAESMARGGKDLPTVLKDLEQSINQATGGRADLRRTISTGRWNRDEAAGPTPFEQELQVRIDERTLAIERETRARLSGDRIEQIELARRVDELDDIIANVEFRASREAPGIDFGQKESIVNALKQDHANGVYKFPDEVMVNKKNLVYEDKIAGDGLGSRVHTQFAKLSNWLYKGLKPVSAADAYLTRGSTYYAYLAKNTKALLDRGYQPEMAYRLAQYRAAFQTRDLMYDLSARSSFDRAVKDVFWFAPVLREQLTTWLYKVPAEAYWPVGFTTLVGSTHNLVGDFKQMGWLREDEEGRLMVKLPVIGEMLGKFQGGPVDFGLDSINPVTPGGSSIVPTLPPGIEALLQYTTDHAPDEIKPFLKTVSRNFTWDHGERGTSWMSSGINGFLQLFGVNPPYKDQWNPTMWEKAERSVHTQSLQFGMSELASEGIVPPSPGAPKSEFDKYEELVEARAADYEGGLHLTHFISYVLSPMSITAIAPAKAEFDQWKLDNGIEFPYATGDWDKIREYTDAHPEALPYTIGRYAISAHPDLPEDAPLADKIAAGDLTELTPEEYWVKAWTMMGMAAEEQRLRTELRAAGIKDAGDQLRNMSTYSEIYGQHLIRLDSWFAANPEIEDYLTSRSDLQLSQTERVALNTSRSLKELQALGVFDKTGSQELGAVRAAIFQATEDITFGPPDSERARTLTYWYDNVYDKYNDEIGPLYNKVEAAFNSGQDELAFQYLDQIKQINNSYGETEYNGHSLPSPEEYSFNSKSEKARRIKTLDWTLSNPGFLSDFQMEQVGIPDFKGRDSLVGTLSGIDERIFGLLANPHLTDAQGDALYAQRDRERKSAALLYGIQGVQFERLASMTPADRLTYTGFGQGNFSWSAVVGQAQAIVDFAKRKGVNVKYASESSGLLQMKVDFERRINFMRAVDPQFDNLFRSLSKAAASHGDDFKLGVPLYEHVFFGQSQNKYEYQDPLVALVEGTP